MTAGDEVMPAPRLALVGRERELGALDELLDAVHIRGAACLVQGDPGVGKSVLLEHAALEAVERGMATLKTVGIQSEAQMPFAGLHQLLRPILAHASELSAAQRESLLGAFGAGTGSPELFLTALAALNLLSDRAVEKPILLLVDDAQWLDDLTCDVLTFIARRLESDPIVLLVTERVGADTAFDRAELRALHVDALDSDSAAMLLDSRAPELSPTLRSRVLTEACGNPLALVELPIAWAGLRTIPQTDDSAPLTMRLERSFAARARELPRATMMLLLVAALNDGGSLAETLAAGALLSDSQATLDDLALAEQAGLIEVDTHQVRFRHPLVRSAIRQTASVTQLHAAHAALAEALVGDRDRCIWHRAAVATFPDEVVAAELDAAAARMRRRSEGRTAAVAALQQGAELTADPARRASRLLGAAELAYESGYLVLAADLVAQAEHLDLSGSELTAMKALREFIDLGKGGTVASLVAIAEQLFAEGQSEKGRHCLKRAAEKCYVSHADQATCDLVSAAVDRLPDARDDAELLAIQAEADPIGRGGLFLARLDQVIRTFDGDAQALRQLGSSLTVVPEVHNARFLLEKAAEEARAEGRIGVVIEALVSLGDAALYSGDWDLALRATDECARLADEAGKHIYAGPALLTQAALVAMQGDEGRSSRLIAEAEEILLPLGLASMATYFAIARSAGAASAGRFADAFEQIRAAFDPMAAAYGPLIGSRALIDLVEAGARTGQSDYARDVVGQLENVVTQNGSLFIATIVNYARPMLADDRDAEALYVLALADQRVTIPFLRARVLLNYGMWLRRQRRVTDSRDPLRSARDAFDAIGAAGWAEHARQELRASGEKSPRRSPERRDDLTPQELQIASMAAEGLTNREIGERLFLSHRTVGSHLYRIFPKLGITSRSELSRVITRADQPVT